MQQIAAWLVARPHNAVIGLAATLLLPILQVVSGIIMVLLVLRQGVRLAVIEGVVAAALLAVVSLVGGAPAAQVVAAVVVIWVPAVLVAVVMQTSRSLTLTLQLTALIVGAVAVAIFGVVDDPVSLARPFTDLWLELMRRSGQQEAAEILAAEPVTLALYALLTIVWVLWTVTVVSLLVGYRLFRQVTAQTEIFGRFRDLDFGRAIATILVVLSIAAFVSGSARWQSVAFIMFVVYWLQGLAIVHWLYELKLVPLFVLIVVYVALPLTEFLMILPLAVVGYLDAWFRFRHRAPLKKVRD